MPGDVWAGLKPGPRLAAPIAEMLGNNWQTSPSIGQKSIDFGSTGFPHDDDDDRVK